MKTKKALISASIFLLISSLPVQAAGLDEIYRDLVRSENSGYLPMFVKNRNSPDFLLDEETLKQLPAPEETKPLDVKTINLENERLKRETEIKIAEERWKNALLSVKNNRVTPFELEEIQKHVDNNEPQAVEIFAWMNARGVGIKPDLIKAFNLYQKAASLNVTNANTNAAQVYKVMTREQRQSLDTFKNN